jgi:hypothetical protein
MPILFMALIALAVFLVIPVMCTTAVIAEHHFTPRARPVRTGKL